MSTTIDSLQIEIQSNSSGAAQGIQELAKALGELKANGTINVAIKNLNKLRDSLKLYNNIPSCASKITALASAMEHLKGVGSVGNIGKSLGTLADSLRGLDTVDTESIGPKLTAITNAVAPLSGIKSGGLGTMVNALAKIGDVTKKLDDDTITAFAARVESLTEKLEPLSTKMTTIQAGLRGVNSKAKSAGNSFKSFSGTVKASAVNLSSMLYIIQAVTRAMSKAVDKTKEMVSQAIEWDGVANRFGRGFGSSSEETYQWIQRLNEEMGINTQQFMQYSSTYATMLKGFGVAQEDAAKMALGYMELTYDIWAGNNDMYKSLEDAAVAVRSAIAGEVEPVRKMGMTIVDSQLAATAATYGIAYSTQTATEELKSYLRYLTMVDQAYDQNLVGTYAKELNTAEGVMRTFSQQLKSLAQAMGSLFLPALTRIMPYIQAFVEILTDAVHRIAALFGIVIQGVDWSGYKSGVGNAADGTNELTEAMTGAGAAAKDLKNATAGFDELNVISPPSGGGGGGGVSAGELLGDFSIDSVWDESIFASIQSKVDDIKEKIQEKLSAITAMVSGFTLALGAILVASGINLPLGIALLAAGAVGLATSEAVNWKKLENNVDGVISKISIVVSSGLLAVGAILALSGVSLPLGIALMAAGAVGLASTEALNWKITENNVSGTVSRISVLVGTSLLAVGAILAFAGVSLPLGIALLAGGAVTMASAVGLNWNFTSEKTKGTITTISAIVGGALLVVGALLAFSGAFLPLGIALMAGGAAALATPVAQNWDTVKNMLTKVVSGIAAFLGGSLIVLGVLLCLTGAGIGLGLAVLAAGLRVSHAAWSLDDNPLTNFVKNLANRVVGIINTVIEAINKMFHITFGGLTLAGKEIIPAFDVQLVRIPLIPTFEKGGFVDEGQLFIAREAGAEMVGSMGSRTAVANNEQIVEGISAGVYKAVSSAISEYGGSSDRPLMVYLDGKQIYASVKKTESERGMHLMGNQLGYAY